MNNLNDIIQTLLECIDSTEPSEVKVIANLYKAIELLKTYATKEQL